MFIDGLAYPFDKENTLQVLGIGTLYTIGIVLLFPILLVTGYFAHIIGESNKNDNKLPEITNVGELFIDGLKMFIVTIVYGLILASVGLGVGILSLGFGQSSTIFFSISMLLLIPIFVLGYLFMAAGMVNFCKNDYKIIKAFDFNEIMDFAFTGKFTIAFLISFIAYPVIEQIIVFGLSITVIGLILYPTVFFFRFIAMGYVLSVAYDETMDNNTTSTNGETGNDSVDQHTVEY